MNWALFYLGEEIDSADTIEEARELQAEYRRAFHTAAIEIRRAR